MGNVVSFPHKGEPLTPALNPLAVALAVIACLRDQLVACVAPSDGFCKMLDSLDATTVSIITKAVHYGMVTPEELSTALAARAQ